MNKQILMYKQIGYEWSTNVAGDSLRIKATNYIIGNSITGLPKYLGYDYRVTTLKLPDSWFSFYYGTWAKTHNVVI